MLDTALPTPLDNEPHHPEYGDGRIDGQSKRIVIFVCKIYSQTVSRQTESAGADSGKLPVNAEDDHQDNKIQTHQHSVDADDVRYTVRFVLAGNVFPD